MRVQTAITNLGVMGYTLMIMGFMGLIATLVYWNSRTVIESALKTTFALAFLYCGYLIIVSKRTLSRLKMHSEIHQKQ